MTSEACEALDEAIRARGYVESKVRVRYAETDKMGVVYHANYLVWFEVGRVEYLRAMGLDYSTMERESKVMLAVLEATARYKAPAKYDDELAVRATMTGIRGPIVRFRYSIVRLPDEVVLCEGETVHMALGPDFKRAELPPQYAERFQRLVHPTHNGSARGAATGTSRSEGGAA
jgi:acyl-CoA thioester hydrolase